MSIIITIRKHVLKNAFDYGKANAGSVVGKAIAEFPDCKKDMKKTMQMINEEIDRVAKLSKQEIEKEMSQFEYTEKKEEKKGFNLQNAEQNKVLTRFPPEPSGYPHIGHAKAAFIDYESAKQYGGKMILRFDDTNPEKEKQEYVDAIKDGLNWLGVKWESESYTSDSMEKIYECAEKLISKDKAYVCTCDQEKISKLRAEMKPCDCRNIPKEKIFERWELMVAGKYKVGQAILRFKGDMASQNTVMRDSTLARLINVSHYRQKKKYCVWPSYDLAVVVMDGIERITHPMRTKEYELRDELYFDINNALEFTKPTLVEFSKLAIKNAPIGKRVITPLVTNKKVHGWDDPRLPTLAGLKRRGILPEAIRIFVLSFGLSKVESEPGWDGLLAENRKLLDPESRHYFFVPNPIKLEIEGMTTEKVELKSHPKKDLGMRTIKVTKSIYIPQSDFEQLKEGEIFRLKDLCNVKIIKKGEEIHGHVVHDEMVDKKVQWISDDKLDCEIFVPHDLLDEKGEFNKDSLVCIKGYCELNCAELNVGDIVQFERFGFCKLDKKEKKLLKFIYTC